jgi:pilus assembly protein CpaF
MAPVHAVIRPVAPRNSYLSIRKPVRRSLKLETLVERGALTTAMSEYLTRAVVTKKNIVIAGGAGAGKTTLLGALATAIPGSEQIVLLEDGVELDMTQTGVVSLETCAPPSQREGGHTLRDLIRTALPMRADRIILGDCRGGEALEMLQALTAGHAGSLLTIHASTPHDALARLEALCLLGGTSAVPEIIRGLLAREIRIVVQIERLPDGVRRVIAISEVVERLNDATHQIEMRPRFEFTRTHMEPDGRVIGDFKATSY